MTEYVRGAIVSSSSAEALHQQSEGGRHVGTRRQCSIGTVAVSQWSPMRTVSLNRFCENALLFLLAFAILWKGGKTLESTWLLFGVAALCFAVLFLRRGFRTDHPTLMLIISLQIVWICLSFIFSKTQNYGFDEVLRTAGLGLLLLWMVEKSNGGEGQGMTFDERFLTFLTTITILACGIGFLVYTFQPVNRFVATFFDPRFHTDYWPNAGAQFLLLAWPIVLWYQISKKYTRGKHYYFLLTTHYSLLALVFGSLFLTYSRGAFLAFLGQLLLFFILLLARRQRVIATGKPFALLTLSIVIGMGMFAGVNELRSFFHPVQSLSEKVTWRAAEGSSSISERSEFWKQAMMLAKENPLLGWGPYSFRFVQPRLQSSPLATSDHPHSVFLKLSMEQGVLAMLFFAVLVGTILYGGVQSSLSGKRLLPHDSYRIGSTLLLVSIAGVLAHNLIDYNLQFVGIALPLWILMGMLVRNGRIKNQELRMKNALEKTSHNSYFIILTSLSALLLLLAVREGFFLVTSSFGRHAEARGEEVKALSWYDRSQAALFPRDLELSRAHLLLESNQLDEAEAAVRSYLTKNSEDPRAWNLLGSILLSLESYSEAIEALKQAFAYGSWNDLSISRNLLEALLADTYSQPTSDAAADSTRLLPHPDLAIFVPEIERRVLAFVEAIRRNTHFAALSPNPEEARKVLLMLTILSPERSEEFRTLDEIIEKESQEERLRLRARPPGWIW